MYEKKEKVSARARIFELGQLEYWKMSFIFVAL